MPAIHIPTPLRTYTDGLATVVNSSDTVAKALDTMCTDHPALRPNLYDKEGNIRSFVNVYMNDEDVRYLPNKMDTELKDTDEISIIPSIAGGR